MSEENKTPTARELLVRAVQEKGEDYVYPDELRLGDTGCLYFHNGAPSCIVGHVAAYAGAQPGELIEQQLTRESWPNAPFTDRELQALECAQQTQDAGGTWGAALKTFDDYMSAPF